MLGFAGAPQDKAYTREGVTQAMRLIAALDPKSAPIDEKTLADDLVFASNLAQVIPFYDNSNRENENWSPFFEDSQVFVKYALISADYAEAKERQSDILRMIQNYERRPESSLSENSETLIYLYSQKLLQTLDEWQQWFQPHPEEKTFYSKIDEGLRLRCFESRKTLLSLQKQKDEESEKDTKLATPESSTSKSGTGKSNQSGNSINLLKLLRATLELQLFQIELMEAASARFSTLLEAPKNLAPHFGLYFCFLHQFKRVREALNNLTGEHLDLFYKERLEEKPAEAIPDRLYLAFQTAPNAERFILPKGTPLKGKAPPTDALTYLTESAIDLSGYTVGRQYTLWISCNKAPIAERGFYLSSPTAGRSSWAPFGEDQRLKLPEERTMQNAKIGFAIASKTLSLAGGERVITITVNYAPFSSVVPPPPSNTEEPLLAPIPRVSYTGPEGWVQVPPEQVKGFEWVTPSEDSPQKTALQLTVTLKASQPPCVDTQLLKHAGGFVEGPPTIQCLFQNPWSLSSEETEGATSVFHHNGIERPISSIFVEVSVTNLNHLTCFNPDGKVIAEKSIPLFGATPATAVSGSNSESAAGSFLIHVPEIFQKDCTTAKLTLEWENLPDPAQYPLGWRSYYATWALCGMAGDLGTPLEQDQLFCNNEYRIFLDYLEKGAWHSLPVTDPPSTSENGDSFGSYFLFENTLSESSVPLPTGGNKSKEESYSPSIVSRYGAPLNLTTTFDFIGLNSPYLLAGTQNETEAVQVNGSQNGFIRLRLLAPSYAFGHALYPKIAMSVALWNSKQALAKATPRKWFQPSRLDTFFDLLVEPCLGRAQVLWLTMERASYRLPDALFHELSALPEAPPALKNWFPIPKTKRAHIPWATALQDLKGCTFEDRYELDHLIFVALNRSIFDPAGLDLYPEDKTFTDLLEPIYLWFGALLWQPMPVEHPQPNPPISPRLSRITLNYTASTLLNFNGEIDPSKNKFYHLTPFAPLTLDRTKRAPVTLMQCEEPGGYLYLGLKGCHPLQTLSLLFIIERTAKPGPPKHLKDLQAAVLVDENWVAVSVKDDTFGLLKSGTLLISMPRKLSTQTCSMPEGFIWLRIYQEEPVEEARVVEIVPQAVSARWELNTAMPPELLTKHFEEPLSAGTISQLPKEEPRITQVRQPLAAFGGRAPESATQFLIRVSERLRHRNRAWSPWDFERLLLQEFPEIFYAQCLPRTQFNADLPAKPAPGHVLLLVLPTLESVPSALPPGFTSGELRAMEEWLVQRASPSARISVANPGFDIVTVDAEVQFNLVEPPDALSRKLNTALKEFISPWIFKQNQLTTTPKKLFQHIEIRRFITSQPYVKTVSNLSVLVGPCESFPLVPTQPWNLLLTAHQHRIRAV